MQTITESIKIKIVWFLQNVWDEVQILKKFTKSSKALCLGVLERKTWLAAPSKVQVLHHRLGKQVCRKENKEHINAKDICQIFQIYKWMLFPDE